MLTREQMNAIADLIEPFATLEHQRPALVEPLFVEASSRPSINYGGAARTFCIHLITELLNFGEISPGKSALVALLDSIRTEVGADKQIDHLIVSISGAAPAKARKLTPSGEDPQSLYRIPMIGREADLQAALELVKAAPLFVVGVGGLGKSRLAYAVWERGEFTDGVWLRLTETTSPEEIIVLLRDHYDLPTQTAPDAVLKRVRMDNRLLAVLDNAESVPQERRRGFVEMIARLRGEGAAVLITSREEWREVNKPRRLQPSSLAPVDAARVVIEMAREESLEWDVSPHAAALAQAARYHPRLIELAVGKLNRMRADQVIAELLALKSPLTDDALTEMIRRTLDQMDVRDGGAARLLLRRLAACAGAFDYEAAQAIGLLDGDAL